MTKNMEDSDEELRKLLKPDLSTDDVNQLLETLEANFAPGKKVDIIKQLDSYDDVNYLVKIDDTFFLCKVHNGVESKDFIDQWQAEGLEYSKCSSVIHLQNNIMSHLNVKGIPTNDPQLNKKYNMPADVQAFTVVSKRHSPCYLVVRLLSWIEGNTMCSRRVLPLECIADAGRFLGRMDLALDELNDPAATRFHAWDGKNTADIRPFVQHIKDERRRKMVNSVIDTFQQEVIDSGDAGKFRSGIIQGDFNDANILMDKDFQICGAIDFGDSVSSWRVLDCSVAMAYTMLSVHGKAGRAFASGAAFLRGFVSVYPLEKIELKHLHLLVACRLACSCSIGAYSYQQNPENTYLLLHSEPAWKALELIWGYNEKRRVMVKKAMNDLFEKACLFSIDDTTDSVIDCTDLSFPDPPYGDLLSHLRNYACVDNNEPCTKRSRTENESPQSTAGSARIAKHGVYRLPTGKKFFGSVVVDADSSNPQSTCVGCKKKTRTCCKCSMGVYRCIDCCVIHSMEAVLQGLV